MRCALAALIMRSFAVATLLAFLPSAFAVACGGGNGSDQPAVTPDGGSPSSTPDGGKPSTTPDAATSDAADASESSSSATGTVDGHAFAATHAIAYPKKIADATGYEILLSDHPIDCASATIEGASLLDIDVPAATGTYPVVAVFDVSPAVGEASADFNRYDATCKTLTTGSSTSGTATVTAIGASIIRGTFDIAFESPQRDALGSASGPFSATLCPGGFPKQLSCTPK